MTDSARYFTVDGANATLPLVSRVVSDILALHLQWRQAVNSYDLAIAEDGGEAESAAVITARTEMGRLAAAIDSCLAELALIGCSFRDFDLGLVDFPAQHQGRVISLCWQSGEPAVAHWHEISAGFAGRQPVESLMSEAGIQ